MLSRVRYAMSAMSIRVALCHVPYRHAVHYAAFSTRIAMHFASAVLCRALYLPRVRYTMSGTDSGYGATRSSLDDGRSSAGMGGGA